MSDKKQEDLNLPGEDSAFAETQHDIPESASKEAIVEPETKLAADDDKSGSKEAVDITQHGVFKRRSVIRACVDSWQYVNSISHDEAVTVRDSDRATSIFLMIMSIATVLMMIFEPLAPQRLPFLVICDALIGSMILSYIANRFGILGTFTPRQALLAWQLMMGATFFGVFLTINLALILGMAVVAGAPSAEIPINP